MDRKLQQLEVGHCTIGLTCGDNFVSQDAKVQLAKIHKVVEQCDHIITSSPSSNIAELQKSTLLVISPGGLESSVDCPETFEDASKPTTKVGKGLEKIVEKFGDKYSVVTDSLKKKELALAERKVVIEKYRHRWDKFHKDLDHLAEQLSTTQPALNDDHTVKEQIGKNEVFFVEV